MLRVIGFIILISLISNHLMACESDQIRQQVIQLESEILLKNAPTFHHAWQDGAIKLDWVSAQSHGQGCEAQLTLQLPEKDLQEAEQYMQQNPAKRILLAAQGYAMLEQTKQNLAFSYQLDNAKVVPDNGDNFALRQLHNNLEYTYQLLAQIRINVTGQTSNSIPWPNELKSSEQSSCRASGKLSDDACACRVLELEKVLSPRQKELVEFIRSQPYSVAAGAMDSFISLSKQIDSRCSQ